MIKGHKFNFALNDKTKARQMEGSRCAFFFYVKLGLFSAHKVIVRTKALKSFTV